MTAEERARDAVYIISGMPDKRLFAHTLKAPGETGDNLRKWVTVIAGVIKVDRQFEALRREGARIADAIKLEASK